MRLTLVALVGAALFMTAGLASAAEGALAVSPSSDLVFCQNITRFIPVPLPASCYQLFLQCLGLGLPFLFCIYAF